MKILEFLEHPRFATYIGAILSGVIVFGTLFTAVSMKFFGYPNNPAVAHWNPLSVFVRNYGASLLLIPVAWALCFAHYPIADSKRAKVGILGIVLIILAMLFFAFTTVGCAIFHMLVLREN